MPVELTAMKNTPSKRASLLIAAWYCCSSSRPGGFIMFVLTHSTMPARSDYYWRKSDSHPRRAAAQAAEAGARSAVSSATSCAESNQERPFFLTERSVVSASPHAPCSLWYLPPQSFPQISYRLLSVETYLGDS